MKKLADITLKDVMDLLIEDVATDKNITKKEARKLIINALCYNTVIAEIKDQITFLLEEKQ